MFAFLNEHAHAVFGDENQPSSDGGSDLSRRLLATLSGCADPEIERKSAWSYRRQTRLRLYHVLGYSRIDCIQCILHTIVPSCRQTKNKRSRIGPVICRRSVRRVHTHPEFNRQWKLHRHGTLGCPATGPDLAVKDSPCDRLPRLASRAALDAD